MLNGYLYTPLCDALKEDEPFFTNSTLTNKLDCGFHYVQFCEKQLGVRLTIGALRKVRETTLNGPKHRNYFTEAEREVLSSSMLHKHSTGLRHYVVLTATEKATEELTLWSKFRKCIYDRTTSISILNNNNSISSVNIIRNDNTSVNNI
jgi:hypothetical protein